MAAHVETGAVPPLEDPLAPRYLSLPLRSVVTHQREERPTGRLRRNDHVRRTCWLYRWGRDVLRAAGWGEAAIAGLVQRPKAGEQRWA
jgi:hypothetical protein